MNERRINSNVKYKQFKGLETLLLFYGLRKRIIKRRKMTQVRVNVDTGYGILDVKGELIGSPLNLPEVKAEIIRILKRIDICAGVDMPPAAKEIINQEIAKWQNWKEIKEYGK